MDAVDRAPGGTSRRRREERERFWERASPGRAKQWIFGTVFTICGILAVCPPVYLAVARRDPVIAGFPFAVAYMLFVGLLVTVAIMALYQYEQARGEVD